MYEYDTFIIQRKYSYFNKFIFNHIKCCIISLVWNKCNFKLKLEFYWTIGLQWYQISFHMIGTIVFVRVYDSTNINNFIRVINSDEW